MPLDETHRKCKTKGCKGERVKYNRFCEKCNPDKADKPEIFKMIMRYNGGSWQPVEGEINEQIKQFLCANNAQCGDIVEIQSATAEPFIRTKPGLEQKVIEEYKTMKLKVTGKIIETRYSYDHEYID